LPLTLTLSPQTAGLSGERRLGCNDLPPHLYF
jgi:hypothetical protein